MAALLSSGLLPAPKHQYQAAPEDVAQTNQEIVSTPREIPPYQKRQNYVPREAADFGDGGAYPEIHVVQYPLNMGKPGQKSTAIISVDVDSNGQVRYDAIVKQGSNKDRLVQTALSDIKEKKGDQDKLALPDEDEERATAERTRLALGGLLDGKIKASKPGAIAAAPGAEDPTYIRYTPNPNAAGFNPAAQQRVIRMVEAQVDPMEPPKHKHKKVPRGPPSPPVPVLHSPPRKLTVKDQQAWKIPPCISNWKNARGYTIPLDKRLAADGRGLQEVTINNKFATLSESLYVAERKAAEGLKMRSQLRKKMSIREKEEKEAELREMANRARMERSGAGQPADRGSGRQEDIDGAQGIYGPGGDDEEQGYPGETEEERTARYQREKLRVERRKERERELRIDNMKGNFRKQKMDRDEGRDISEKIALGMHKGTGKLSGEAMYDSRLFNQSAGIDSGFGGDDEYNTYNKPLFEGRSESSSIYRPKQDDSDIYGNADDQLTKLKDTSRFKADKGFKGTEHADGAAGGGRSAPVQFQKGEDSDPFGIGDVVGKKRARGDDSP